MFKFSKRLIPNKKGFTLIELMVAISIIAILSTIGIVSFTQAQRVSRDTKRKQDLRSIQSALELYRITNGSYPALADTWYLSATGVTWIPNMNETYISPSLPVDPKQAAPCYPWNSSTCYNYAYYSWTWCTGVANYSYLLAARLENSGDTQAGNTINYKGPTGGNCPWGGLSGVMVLTNP